MQWKIKITASAREDIRNIKNWYKQQSHQAVENFTKELIAAIESLQKDSIEYKMVHHNYRRLLLKKFPYTIYYQRIELTFIVEINAVFHNHRNTDLITKRLNE